ncbi:YhdP family protein [Bordetella sp. FB-8]|uniref:YhdP family protein n=1 Tax=Bordetella sp. FB-8 TaxID=1159870 RepID=UPI00037812D1|nr:YhdP family protein [Bordetella sp. FB-8]
MIPTTQVLRFLFWGVLAVVAIFLMTCLGLRYLVLPKIDQWRPQIEHYASRAVGAPVHIGAIAADWSGLDPRLHLSAVQFYGGPDKSQPTVSLPSVDAVVGWRSVFRLAPRLLSLSIKGADLTVRRDAAGLLWVAGMSFDPADASSEVDSPLLVWLSQQRQLALTDTTVHWLDEKRQAPELVFRHIDALLRNGLLSHRFALHLTPPQALSAGITVRGELKRRFFTLHRSGPSSWNGDFYLQIDDTEPASWSPWVAVPPVKGRFAARAWVKLTHGQIGEVTLDAVARGLDTALPGQAGSLAARQVRLHLDGMPGNLGLVPRDALPVPLAHGRAGQGVLLQIQAQGVQARLPRVFDTPSLKADTLNVDASLVHPSGKPLTLELRQLQLKNDDIDLSAQGRWRNDGGAGTADLQGRIVRASVSAIASYLPQAVNPDVRRWMRDGLLAGQVSDAAVKLKGRLDEFPFTGAGSAGTFRVAGRFQGARLDYAPAHGDRKGWPLLADMSGTFEVDKSSLTLDSAGGSVQTGPDQSVALQHLHATIANMEHDAQLEVSGTSAAPVPAYLAVAANSPLGKLLDGMLDHAQGSGDWQVSLNLYVPLLHTQDTRVDGHILFQGNTLRFMPQLPALGDLQGDLAFSDQGMQTKSLRGTFLGGPMQVSGKLGHGDSLAFSGTLAAAALDELGKLPAWKRLSGRTAYQGRLSYAKGGEVDATVRSDLAGLAIDLPAPLGKAASGSLPLSLKWGPAADGGRAGRRWLSGEVGRDINLLLEYDPSDRRAAYFARGAIGFGRAASLPARGLSLSGKLDTLDVDAWNDTLKSFAPPSEAKGKARSRPEPPILPELSSVSLSARHLVAAGQDFDDLTLDAQQPAPRQWRVSIDSRQSAGTLEWAQASDTTAGKITARFTRLSLGKAGETDNSGQGERSGKDRRGDLSDFPGIDLQAKQFVFYGHDLGSLSVSGTNLERGNLWRLDKLDIANDLATLNATGTLRMSGPDRGLTANADINFKDLGAMLDRLDLHPIGGGHGTLQGKFFWRDLPWRHDMSDVDGSFHVNFEKGRFINVSSHAARLLELLSLQSIQRLATLNTNPVNLLRQGFPFDTITGDMRLSKGVMNLETYKINGPSAAVALEGKTDIVNETWDLHAIVVPNLDASGAAIAATLVNPVIGIGAFITQWLLNKPLARALASEYHVTGSWDAPKIDAVETKAPLAETASQIGH